MAWGDIAPVIKRPKSVLFHLKTASLHETPVSFRFWAEKKPKRFFTPALTFCRAREPRAPVPLPGFMVCTGFLQESQTIVPLVHREFMRSAVLCKYRDAVRHKARRIPLVHTSDVRISDAQRSLLYMKRIVRKNKAVFIKRGASHRFPRK